MHFKDRVVLITGASRGIGAATAKGFGSHGAKVAVNYFASEEAAKQVVDYIKNDGAEAIAYRADVRNPEQVEAMVKAVNQDLGPVDTLVINASMQFPIRPFSEYRWDDFSAKLIGELQAAFHCSKAVLPSMNKLKRGCIIGVSSTLSRNPGTGFVAHSTAKSGLDAFMKSLALELGPLGIRVNVVAPGLTLTDATAFMPEEQKQAAANFTPLRRNAEPNDIAGAIMAMASDDNRFVTGAYLPVAGGGFMP